VLPDISALTHEQQVILTLAQYQRRLRVASICSAVIAGAGAGGAVLGLATLSGGPVVTARIGAAISFFVVALVVGVGAWRRWTSARVAAVAEARTTGLENLLVTTEEILGERARRVHPIMRAEILRATADRIQRVSSASVQPVRNVVMMSGSVFAAFLLLLFTLPEPRVGFLVGRVASPAGTSLSPGVLRVVVTPPPYAGRSPVESIDPTTITVLEGSHIRLEASESSKPIQVVGLAGTVEAFQQSGGIAWHELTATSSRLVVIQRLEATQGQGSSRLLQIHVEPDRRPVVRIVEPGQDLMFGTAAEGRVGVAIEARDDIALRSLALRFTRVVGSGEGLSFQEGDLPIAIDRAADGTWRARATLILDQLKLQDGDTLVYRAVATDARPGSDPSSSESFLIEIGRLSGVASTGFAVPEDRDRQALSQQMLIIKTERLHAARPTLAPEAVAEQSRLLAVEQRMVRAEFVFMTGGEVVDEVEEATHAHELAEGRLTNEGQVELLAAVREMSRAEARLNAADTTQALEFERAALRALQRAFDRRRYFLRTLPERARIDEGRRLSGDRSQAQSSNVTARPVEIDPVVTRARDAMRQVAAALGTPGDLNAFLAARVLAADPESDVLRRIATELSAATTDPQRRQAAFQAQHALMALVIERAGSRNDARIVRDPLSGRVADELTRLAGKQ
jgi:hypothetical protein